MADAPENLKEAEKTESRFIEEPKVSKKKLIQELLTLLIQTLISKIRTPDRRLDARKRETKDLGLKISERGQIRDHKGSNADIRENLQRRSHETESRSLPHKKRASVLDWGDQSEYPYHPGERDRRESRENEHSVLRINEAGKIQQSLRDVEMQQKRSHETESRFLQHKNRYFMRGDCKNGSACQFIHPKNMDRRATESNRSIEKQRREEQGNIGSLLNRL